MGSHQSANLFYGVYIGTPSAGDDCELGSFEPTPMSVIENDIGYILQKEYGVEVLCGGNDYEASFYLGIKCDNQSCDYDWIDVDPAVINKTYDNIERFVKENLPEDMAKVILDQGVGWKVIANYG